MDTLITGLYLYSSESGIWQNSVSCCSVGEDNKILKTIAGWNYGFWWKYNILHKLKLVVYISLGGTKQNLPIIIKGVVLWPKIHLILLLRRYMTINQNCKRIYTNLVYLDYVTSNKF